MDKNERENIKRSRMMKYFIDAANKIIKKKGIDAVNIRDAANLAGYSSATLYNYFDNLTHLVFLATFNQLEEYNKALAICIAKCKNSIEVYMRICRCFCDFAYEKPEIYEILFFSHNDGKFDNYIEQYYKLFPNKDYKNLPNFLGKMFKSNDIHARSLFMLENCIKDGYLDKLNIDDFNDICLRFNKTILQDVRYGILSKEEATELTLKYYYHMFHCCIKKEHIRILDECYSELTKI